MPATATATGFPQAPFVDPQTGDIASVWRFFLMGLWNRTGAAPGVSSGTTAAGLAAEAAARSSADTSLSDAISNEAAARLAAVTAEANARLAADNVLAADIAALAPGGATGSDVAMLTRWWFGP